MSKHHNEEKELNLCEILSSGDLLESEFFSPAFGKVTLSEVIPAEREVVIMNLADGCEYSLNPYGCLMSSPHGFCVLFPSRALYKKYPLDPAKAWREWQESRKSKYILEIEISSWTDGEDGRENENYEGKKWFKFDSAMELKQAAEAVRECLAKFHENQSKQ